MLTTSFFYLGNFHVSASFDPSHSSNELPDFTLAELDPSDFNLLADNTSFFNTYFGGLDDDFCYSLALDSADNIVIAGSTTSENFPVLNALDSTLDGYSDGFIAKFSADGQLLWSSFLGGSEGERVSSIAIDFENNIIATGVTTSADFPVSSGFDETFNGGGTLPADIFVTKLDPDGNILWSSFIGGNSSDSSCSISIDLNNDIIISGDTYSPDFPSAPSNLSFPNADAFILKLNSSGSLIYSTVFGGNASDYILSSSTDSSDNIVLLGLTASLDFSLIDGFVQDPVDRVGFLAKFFSNGSFIWGNFIDIPNAYSYTSLTLDSSDNIIVSGTELVYTLDPLDMSFNADAFLLKYSPDGEPLWDLFFDSEDFDYSHTASADSSDNLFLTRLSVSGFNSPSAVANVFLTKIDSTGEIIWEGPFGGDAEGICKVSVCDSNDDIVVAGDTASANFIDDLGYDFTHNGNFDVFLCRLSGSSPPSRSSKSPVGLFLPTIGFLALLTFVLKKKRN